MKIYEAAIAALNSLQKPATASEVYETIVGNQLYVLGQRSRLKFFE
ncbi:hypothetical protein AB4149_07390 [Vibrio cyclitrophicus]